MQEQLKLKPRPRDAAVPPNETARPPAALRELRPAQPQRATAPQLSRLRNRILRQEHEAWSALTDLLDPGGLDPKLLDGFHRELSRQMLKLCWLHARSGALEERYDGSHPFLRDLENAELSFEDEDFSGLDL